MQTLRTNFVCVRVCVGNLSKNRNQTKRYDIKGKTNNDDFGTILRNAGRVRVLC